MSVDGRMRYLAPVIWCSLVAFETGAQIGLRLGGMTLADLPPGPAWAMAAMHSPGVLIAIACYVFAFVTWLLILRRTSLSVAFPASGIVFVSVLLTSWLMLGDSIQGIQWVGILMILSGIWMLAPGEG
jgi:multidrug transporter EmrE-like cation transporter